MANLRKKQRKNREKSHFEFAIAVSRQTGISGMLNEIANRAYKARADWINHWLSTVRTGPNEHSVRTMESKPVHTHSNSLSAHPVVRTHWRYAPWKRPVWTV